MTGGYKSFFISMFRLPKKLVFKRQRKQIVFLLLYFIKKIFNNICNFGPKPWTNPFGKMGIFWVFESDVFMVQTGLFFDIKRQKIVFLRFIFRVYNMGIQGVTRGDRRLQRLTRGDRGLQGLTGGYKGLQGVTKSYKGLRGVTRGYKG